MKHARFAPVRMLLPAMVGVLVFLTSALTVRPRYPNLSLLECAVYGFFAMLLTLSMTSLVRRISNDRDTKEDEVRTKVKSWAGDAIIVAVGSSMLSNLLPLKGVVQLVVAVAFWGALIAAAVLLVSLSFVNSSRD